MLFKENKGLKIEKEFVKNIIDFCGWVEKTNGTSSGNSI